LGAKVRVRKRHRKKLLIGEFLPGATVAFWLASAQLPHRDQSFVAASLSELAERHGLDSRGFGSLNEWFFVLLPTRTTHPPQANVTSAVENLLATREDVVQFTVRHFQSSRAATKAYDALLHDFEARHPG
jgi:uncharacterized protein YggL (DUF469 family)